MKEVDGDTMEGFLDAIISGERFDVCYDEAFNSCLTIPGWQSAGIGLIIIELLFWVLVVAYTYRRVKKHGRIPTEHFDENRPDKR